MGLTGDELIAGARVYLDHAATTPVAPAVVAEMVALLERGWGNPSSAHARGREARRAVDDARDRLAAVLGCAARELTFTGGGTEADNLAIRGTVERWGGERGRHVVVGATEHEAVLSTADALAARGLIELTVVGCDSRGVVDAAEVAAAVRDDTVLVSVMLANNEIGTLQDVAAIAAAVHARNPATLVHTDAVQAFGKLPLIPDALGVDLLSLSAHKVYGPKGCGALWARRGTLLTAQMEGGGQERGRRSGTENTAAIAGFAVAAELVAGEMTVEMPRQQALRDRLEAAVVERVPAVRVGGSDASRLPNLAALLVDGSPTEPLVTALDLDGIEVSGGSACSSGAARPSHVLRALGEDPERTGLVRVSLGRGTTAADVERAATSIATAVQRALATPVHA